MSDVPSVIEQATPLAPPEQHAEQNKAEEFDGFIDLDAGDSLLDEKPDDGRDTPEQEAPASEETQQAEETEAGGDGEEPELSDDELLETLAATSDKPKKPSGSARLKAQVAELQAEIERLKQGPQILSNPADMQSAVEREIGPPPKETDFEDYLEFQAESIAYRAERKRVERELKKASEQAETSRKEHVNRLLATFNERANEVRAIYPDFDAVLQKASAATLNQEVNLAIVESKKGPTIAYYLAQKPEVVNAINAMPLREALMEIGRLEARLTPVPQKQTKAPEPAKPLPTASGTKQKALSDYTDSELERMPMAQFNKLMKAHEQNRR